MTPPSQYWNEVNLSEDPTVELLRKLGFTYVGPEVLEVERNPPKDTIMSVRVWTTDGAAAPATPHPHAVLRGTRVPLSRCCAGRGAQFAKGRTEAMGAGVPPRPAKLRERGQWAPRRTVAGVRARGGRGRSIASPHPPVLTGEVRVKPGHEAPCPFKGSLSLPAEVSR